MKTLFTKLFLWIKDRFSLLFTVCFRLHIGGTKKENPSSGDEDSTERIDRNDRSTN